MIQELLILNYEGIPLFYHNFLSKFNKKDDYQLIASFLDQIYQFTKAGFKENLTTIVWKDLIFLFYTHQESNFRLIFKCENPFIDLLDDMDIIKKPLDTIAKKILNKFLIKYKNDLNNFNGEISRFKSFSEDVSKIFTSH